MSFSGVKFPCSPVLQDQLARNQVRTAKKGNIKFCPKKEKFP